MKYIEVAMVILCIVGVITFTLSDEISKFLACGWPIITILWIGIAHNYRRRL